MPLEYRKEYKISEFRGLWTETQDNRELQPTLLADGTYAVRSPDALNWITHTNLKGIALRRGMKLLGTTRQPGSGKITGLGVGRLPSGTEVPFFTHGRKAKYYDSDSDDTAEVDTTDLLPQAAVDADDVISIYSYTNMAGAFVYLSSPHSSVYKIAVANPGSVKDMSSSSYRGFFTFGQSRGFLLNRRSTDGQRFPTTLYTSKVDKADVSQYPSQVTGEAVGSLGSTHYTHTLAQITGIRSAFAVVVEATTGAGTEQFTDDGEGNLSSNFGGTGTVNYLTGAIVVDFASTTTGAVTCEYYYEAVTTGGVVDFSISNPSSRQPGEGNIFPQFGGGGVLKAVVALATTFFCFHTKRTWQVSIPVDDESGTDSISINLPYREKIGTNSHYGAFGGSQAAYVMNTADPNKPELVALEFTKEEGVDVTTALPRVLSQAIDFSPYAFDANIVREWGDYILSWCAQIRNGLADTYNSRLFMLNKKSGAWDVVEYLASCADEYEGTLLAGSPLSNNVFVLFSGFDDDDNAILNNYWTSGDIDLDMDGIKRFTRVRAEGLIQASQRYEIQLSFDGGSFTTVATVDGRGSYVNTAKSIAVGSYTLGSKEIGGGSVVYANPYEVEFRVQSPRFRYVRVRIQAATLDDAGNPGGGYVSVHSLAFGDIRQKSLRPLPERVG